jgi:single-strand DNA-binding protein
MNHTQLLGRITRDLEIKTSQGGMSLLSFSIAVPRDYKKEGEERQTDFIMCKCFGKTAEFIQKYFSKGSMIGVAGKIQTGSYDKDGVKVYTTDVIVDKAYFTGEKKNDASQESSFTVLQAEGDSELPF